MYLYPIILLILIISFGLKYGSNIMVNTTMFNTTMDNTTIKNYCTCGPRDCKNKDDSECNIHKILNINPKDGPCYLYENTNRTQKLYLKLLDVFKSLSDTCEEKLSKTKRNVYIQGTIDNRLKTELNEINEILLSKINQKLKPDFETNFKIVSLDTITELVDPSGNRNFKYLLFTYDKNEVIQLRLYIDIIKYIVHCPEKTQKITCTSIATPGMDTFEIGYPQPEQLLPLPTQTVNTGAPDLLSADGINIKKIPPIARLHINEIKIYNTDSVINANGQCIMDGVCGNIKETSLSSSAFNQPTTPFQEPSCVRNKWMRLPDEPVNVKAWPCGEVSQYWDSQSIPITETCGTQFTGIRSSTTQIPVSAEYYPTLATIPRNSGPNSWLFSLTRGDPATEGADFTSSL